MRLRLGTWRRHLFALLLVMAEEHFEEKVLLEWEAPERIFVKRGKKYFQNLFAILFIFAAIAIFFREFLLAAVLGVLGFLQYALGTTPPGRAKHRITTHCIATHGQEYPWEELEDFWFAESNRETVLNIDTKRLYPGRLFLLLGSLEKVKVASVLKKYIPLRKRPPEDFLEKLSSEVSRRIKLE